MYSDQKCVANLMSMKKINIKFHIFFNRILHISSFDLIVLLLIIKPFHFFIKYLKIEFFKFLFYVHFSLFLILYVFIFIDSLFIFHYKKIIHKN